MPNLYATGYNGTSGRFWTKVDQDGPIPEHRPELGPCWLWTAGTNDGYGHFAVGRGHVKAHRWMYGLLVGPILEGLQLDHLCRVRHCVNPAHLEPVTHQENVLRGTGPTAINAQKTDCPRGHSYSGSNLYVNPKGSRVCRSCLSDAMSRYRQRCKGSPL